MIKSLFLVVSLRVMISSERRMCRKRHQACRRARRTPPLRRAVKTGNDRRTLTQRVREVEAVDLEFDREIREPECGLGGTFIRSPSCPAAFLDSQDPDETCSLTKRRYGSATRN